MMVAIIQIVSFILIHLVCVMNTKNELSLFASDNLENLFKSFTTLMIDLTLYRVKFSKSEMFNLYELSNRFIGYYNTHYSDFV